MRDAIQAEGLVKRFGGKTALDGLNLSARDGTVLGLLGPNGAGKTTVVRILATLLRPDSGRVRVCGLDPVRDAAKLRRLIGLTGQYAAVDEDLTGAENLALVGRLLDLRRDAAKARAAELLDRFGLADDARRKVSTYSGGMRRRLDLAASLVGDPAVVYLDEPTTGLDPARRGDVWRMVRAMAADGVTVLLTTQYLDEADALADEISVVDHGRVVAAGTPAALKQRVGGQTLVVRPREVERADEVARIVGAITGQLPDTANGVVVAPTRGDEVLPEVVQRLGGAGIVVTELSLRLPSLDEVFLTLTGHGTGDKEVAA
ncbi:daunorubicin resistance protein DrrA family ABC transporter ATP-binding protein [Actinocatenispora thailandica]|uniref:Daunorubicin resistance protein DrrA family ABC transporter ATP-binding protein n=1 Tax=Actinocatenispora thailandica TaxID=227318 RepID=A0A7R7HVM3_9ACTN|nr:ATP-binding cassette domain-containing protein [Actinocatenispora thailandica]BCJ33948.1 daunorubicin resistance protein DrrA family ABC transporter ATP-binding protein [Actinocatenispora thailandica]